MSKIVEQLKSFYDKHLIMIALVPIIFLLASVSFLGYSKISSGEFVGKDVSLSGGVMITISTGEQFDISSLEVKVPGATIRAINVPGSSEILGYSFESKTEDVDGFKDKISLATGIELEEGSYSIEETSSSLSTAFWKNAVLSMVLAYFFIGGVVFIFFKKVVPSLAIMFSVISDLVETLAVMNLLGMELSTAGIAAILMLIGYGVDSNILLTTKIMKGKGESFMSNFVSAFKTGMTMQFATVAALLAMIFFSPAEVIKSIASILLIGIFVDMMNTWVQNTAILKLWSKKWAK